MFVYFPQSIGKVSQRHAKLYLYTPPLANFALTSAKLCGKFYHAEQLQNLTPMLYIYENSNLQRLDTKKCVSFQKTQLPYVFRAAQVSDTN